MLKKGNKNVINLEKGVAIIYMLCYNGTNY